MDKKLYKILAPGRVPRHSGADPWHHCAWMPPVNVKPCHSGYHLCQVSDLSVWADLLSGQCLEIWEAKGREVCVPSINKIVYSEARLVRKVGKLTHNDLFSWALDCAERVLPIWEKKYPDADQLRKAIQEARNGKLDSEGSLVVHSISRNTFPPYSHVARAIYFAVTSRIPGATDAACYACGDCETIQIIERTWQGKKLLEYAARSKK